MIKKNSYLVIVEIIFSAEYKYIRCRNNQALQLISQYKNKTNFCQASVYRLH